jgi:hypothetical protein
MVGYPKNRITGWKNGIHFGGLRNALTMLNGKGSNNSNFEFIRPDL